MWLSYLHFGRRILFKNCRGRFREVTRLLTLHLLTHQGLTHTHTSSSTHKVELDSFGSSHVKADMQSASDMEILDNQEIFNNYNMSQ